MQRLSAVGITLVLVAVGITVFVTTRGSSKSHPDSFCWGALPAAEAEALLAPGKYEDEHPEPLDYPGKYEPHCNVERVGDPSGLGWLEYVLYDDYRDRPVGDWGLYENVQLSYPLGDGLVGFASDLGGWVEVPSCKGTDAPRYFQLVARGYGTTSGGSDYLRPARPGNHRLIAEVLVRTANNVRVKAGCTGPALPAAVGRADAPVTPYDDAALCGRPVAELGLPAHPGWTQQWTGPGASSEDCLVFDPAAADGVPVVRLEVRRGRFAELGTQYPEGKISEARPQIAAAYVANCASGRVSYRLDIKTPGQFPDPQAMLRTVVAANAERDGCALPQ